MYKTLSGNNLSSESLAKIIHFVIGVLIKYKNVFSSELDINTLTTVPDDEDLLLAHQLLDEIDAKKLIDNDVEIDKIIYNLYLYLKESMEISLNTSDENGVILLNKLRRM